jgi:integrase
VARGNLRLVNPEDDQPRKPARKQRRHKPDVIGSRVFERGGKWYIDRRWAGEGRVLLRDPSHPLWPDEGQLASGKAEAKQWASVFDQRRTAELEREAERRSGIFRFLSTGAEAFLAYREVRVSESTYSGDRTAVAHLLEEFGGTRDPASVTPHELDAFFGEFLRQGYKVRSVRNTCAHLIMFFDFLKVKPNPAGAVSLPAEQDGVIAPWSEEEKGRLRRAADELDANSEAPFRRRLVEFLLATGVRIQECAAAKWQDIDARRRVIEVAWQIARSSNKPVQTKGKKVRTAAILPDWWDHHRPESSGLIFPGANGRPIRYRTLYGYVRELLEHAELKREGEAGHQFRHTYSFDFLTLGGTIDQLQKSLGHKRVSTTQQYYDHFTTEHAAEAGVERIYGGKYKVGNASKSARRGPRRKP